MESVGDRDASTAFKDKSGGADQTLILGRTLPIQIELQIPREDWGYGAARISGRRIEYGQNFRTDSRACNKKVTLVRFNVDTRLRFRLALFQDCS